MRAGEHTAIAVNILGHSADCDIWKTGCFAFRRERYGAHSTLKENASNKKDSLKFPVKLGSGMVGLRKLILSSIISMHKKSSLGWQVYTVCTCTSCTASYTRMCEYVILQYGDSRWLHLSPR